MDRNTAAMRPGARGRSLLKTLKPYLFLLPIVVFAVGFVYYPFIKTCLYSVSRVNAKGQITGFVGIENFEYLFTRRDFKIALGNTLKLTLINVPATLFITISLAMLANRRRRLSGLYEMMFTLPMAVSMSAAALIFKVLLNPTVGFVNYALNIKLGWFEDKQTAMYGILLLTVWMGTGFNFLLFLSAFRGVPEQLVEAATIDGAGFFSRLFKIQLPLVSPTILYVVCTDTVLAMMTSGPIIILTQGGPSRSTTTLLYMMYASGYGSSNYSMAACVSLVAFCMTLAFTLAAFSLEGKRVHYQ